MDPKERTRDIMNLMSQGRVGALFDAMAEDFIQEVREYMDTQLVTETFGPDGSS